MWLSYLKVTAVAVRAHLRPGRRRHRRRASPRPRRPGCSAPTGDRWRPARRRLVGTDDDERHRAGPSPSWASGRSSLLARRRRGRPRLPAQVMSGRRTRLALALLAGPGRDGGAGRVRRPRVRPDHRARPPTSRKFSPAQFEVAPGTTVTLVVHNLDPIGHELIIGDAGVHERHEKGTEPYHAAPAGRGVRARRGDPGHDLHVRPTPAGPGGGVRVPPARPLGLRHAGHGLGRLIGVVGAPAVDQVRAARAGRRCGRRAADRRSATMGLGRRTVRMPTAVAPEMSSHGRSPTNTAVDGSSTPRASRAARKADGCGFWNGISLV